MPVRSTIPYSFGTLFIIFTCHNWLPLIDKVNGYDIIYKWFDHLKSKGHFINGFVIMPNGELSFKRKECSNRAFMRQKLDYMHANPFVKKYDLSKNPLD